MTKGHVPSPVLVVDDDDDIRRLMIAVLEGSDIDVVEAASGDAALAVLAEREVSAVVLDRMMPGIDGIEVLHQIRSRPATALLPVILVTALSDLDDRVEGLDVGADDYLGKPFDPAELVARVRAQVRGHAAWVRTLTAEIDQRTALMHAASAATSDDPIARAQALCTEIVRLPSVAGAELLEIIGSELLPVASAGDLAPPLVAGSRAVIERAADGPWLQRDPHLALAPVSVDGDLVALLTVVPKEGRADAERSLAIAVDFAALAEGLVAVELRSSVTRAVARDRLADLIACGRFRAVFQPIIDLRSSQPVGWEALTRFDDGALPEVLFADAAAMGLGAELEVATLGEALGHSSELPPGTWLALNVSPTLLLQRTRLGTILDRSAGPSTLVLEVSEAEQVQDYEALRNSVAQLGQRVQLSVDDAGSGFASLSHILQLRAEFVKLDKAWITDIDQDPAKQALVAGLQHFATRTGSTLIAEGVETDAELATISDLGLQHAQGFLLGRPVEL